MVFFLALLHAIFQYPKDILEDGIAHCQGPRKKVSAAASGTSLTLLPYEKLAALENVINRKVLGVYPSISENEKLALKEVVAPLIKSEFWSSAPTNRQIIINGYDATEKHSFMIYFNLSNDFVPVTTKKLYYSSATSISEGMNKKLESYSSILSFKIVGEEITDKVLKVSKKFEIFPMELIDTLAAPVSTFVFGFAIGVNDRFIQLGAKHLRANSVRYAALIPYLNASSEVINVSLDHFIAQRIIDLTPINQEIIRVCSITPTPTPEPLVPKRRHLWDIFNGEEEHVHHHHHVQHEEPVHAQSHEETEEEHPVHHPHSLRKIVHRRVFD